MNGQQPRHRPNRSPTYNCRRDGQEEPYSLRQSRSLCDENNQFMTSELVNSCNDRRSPPSSSYSSNAVQISERCPSPNPLSYSRNDIESNSDSPSRYRTNNSSTAKRQSPPLPPPPPPPQQPTLISSPLPRNPFSSPLQGDKRTRVRHGPNKLSPPSNDPFYHSRSNNGQNGNFRHHSRLRDQANFGNAHLTLVNRCLSCFRTRNLLFVLVATALSISMYNVSLESAHLVAEYHQEPKQENKQRSSISEDSANASETRITKRRNEEQLRAIKNVTSSNVNNALITKKNVESEVPRKTKSQPIVHSSVEKEQHEKLLSNPQSPDSPSLTVLISPSADGNLAANFSNFDRKGQLSASTRILFVDWTFHRTFPLEDFHQGIDSERARPTLTRVMNTYQSEFSDQTQLYPKYPSNDILRMQRFDRNENTVEGYGNCVPVNQEKSSNNNSKNEETSLHLPWQHTFHPTCNSFHEVDMFHRVTKHWSMSLDLFGLKGFWRHAWHLHDVDALTGSYIRERVLEKLWYNPDRWESFGSKKMKKIKKNILKKTGLENEPPGVVLKTLKYEHNYEAAFFETNRIDAVAMERLTGSPHVTDIYGFCGMSVITEYGEGDFKPLIDAAPPLEKLKYAIDVASGLAATHYMDGYDKNVTMVHNDLNPTNVMVSNGTVKLNDYNIGIFTTWHEKEQRMCRFHNKDFANAQWRAPEEQFIDDEPSDEAHTEKIDIYALGNIFFRIIAEHDPWKEYKIDGRIYPEQRNEIAKRKRHLGDLPTYLDKPEVETSTDPSIVAIRNIMIKCFSLNPMDRPTAIEIEKELSDAYKKILSEQN